MDHQIKALKRHHKIYLEQVKEHHKQALQDKEEQNAKEIAKLLAE